MVKFQSLAVWPLVLPGRVLGAFSLPPAPCCFAFLGRPCLSDLYRSLPFSASTCTQKGAESTRPSLRNADVSSLMRKKRQNTRNSHQIASNRTRDKSARGMQPAPGDAPKRLSPGTPRGKEREERLFGCIWEALGEHCRSLTGRSPYFRNSSVAAGTLLCSSLPFPVRFYVSHLCFLHICCVSATSASSPVLDRSSHERPSFGVR